MQKKIAKLIVEACQAEGMEVSLHENYSGRGMHGSATSGISLGRWESETGVQDACHRNRGIFDEEDIEVPRIENFRRDSLGLGLIIY